MNAAAQVAVGLLLIAPTLVRFFRTNPKDHT